MRMATRKMLDRSFTLAGVLAIGIMTASLLVILAPIFTKGMSAYVFKGTVEHRRMLLEKFGRGDRVEMVAEIEASAMAKKPVYDMISAFEVEVEKADAPVRRKLKTAYKDLKKQITMLLGPMPSEPRPLLVRNQYGQMRWHRAEDKLHALLFVETWDYSDASGMGKQVMVPRVNDFKGTALEPMFAYLEANIDKIMQPRLTFYWGFLTDASFDSHFIGGIWPEVIGTIYLTLGAMLFAIPMGLIAAIYLTEYARDTFVVRLLRTCISTLAGVPSIVFGLFGLAFFINTLKVSESKSVLAGSMTLALLVLPTLIRASEEAIKSVPHTFKEAALSLGSGKWKTVLSVILPAALPGILTGIVLSMGRAAGETAPIIFTAAVSVGKALSPMEVLTQPTPALPWNIFNLSTEHEAVDEIRHVQFGMVMTLVLIVLLLNLTAIVLRAKVSRKLKG